MFVVVQSGMDDAFKEFEDISTDDLFSVLNYEDFHDSHKEGSKVTGKILCDLMLTFALQ